MSLEQSFLETIRADKLGPTAPLEDSPVEKSMASSDQDFGKPVTLRTLFTHHDTHPVVLDLSLMKQFGVDWLTWQSPTLWSEIRTEFKTEISEHSRAKIQTIRTCHISDLPWEKWQVFEKIIQGLNNNIPQFEVMQAPSLEQLYAGIDILSTVRDREYSNEVKLYMAAAVQHEEVTYVPAPLDFIQMEVSQPHYVCQDCGNKESALFSDGVCTVCSRKVAPDKGMSMLPDATVVQGVGKNLAMEMKYSFEHIRDRWATLKSTPLAKAELNETEEDVQVAKLMIARDYMNIRRKQLADQLTSLRSWLGAE